MDKIKVADIGVDGGGITIYGRHVEGVWSFWTEGLDENDNEVVRIWSSEPVADLSLIVPSEWTIYHVLEIHPEFLGWFRERYEEARTSLSPDLREMQAEFQHRQWAMILGL
jgi:hypothetical protein